MHDYWLQGVLNCKRIAPQVFQSVMVVWLPLVVATQVSENCCIQLCDWSYQAFCIIGWISVSNLFWL